MNSSTASSMAPALADYHRKSANLRSNILKNEQQRLQLEEKLRSMTTIDSRLKQRQQTDQVQSYFTRLNEESQRAEQRNLTLLNDISHAEQTLNQLRIDTERLIRSKYDYAQYLESTYPTRPKATSSEASTTVYNRNTYDFDRLNQATTLHPSNGISAVVLFKPSGEQHGDDPSMSESTTSNTFSRSKRAGSLRMELSLDGLYFLLDYLEKELHDTIDKRKFYRHDPPTITQKRTILDIANDQQHAAIKDLESSTTSMVILDQLPSTIRRTTVNHCLLTEEILSANIKDLDKDAVTKMLPGKDHLLWTRLIVHFSQLLKYHIMTSQTLANQFAPLLLPSNALFLHDKAKSLLQHIVEKSVATQQASSDDEISTDRRSAMQQLVQANPTAPSSSWLDKLKSGGTMDDDLSSSSASSTTPKKNVKSISSLPATPKANAKQDDSDSDFFD